MKKNLRIVSAAAAALLAVAPIAATAMPVNAAANQTITLPGAPASTKGDVTLTSNVEAVTYPERTITNNNTGVSYDHMWNGKLSGNVTATFNGKQYTVNLPSKPVVALYEKSGKDLKPVNANKEGKYRLVPGDVYYVYVQGASINLGTENANLSGKTLGSENGDVFFDLREGKYTTGIYANESATPKEGEDVDINGLKTAQTATPSDKITAVKSGVTVKDAKNAKIAQVVNGEWVVVNYTNAKGVAHQAVFSKEDIVKNNLIQEHHTNYISGDYSNTLPVKTNQNGGVTVTNSSNADLGDTFNMLVRVIPTDVTNAESVNFFEKATNTKVTTGTLNLTANPTDHKLNVNTVLSAALAKYSARQDGDKTNSYAYIDTDAKDITDQLTKAGIKVDALGNFEAPASFSFNLHAQSDANKAANGLPITVSVTNGVQTPAAAETTRDVTIMHISTIYDKNGKATHEPALRAYNSVKVVSDPVNLKDENGKDAGKFYKLAGKDEYIKVGNVDGTKRTLRHNSYVYKSTGKRANKKTLKKGATVTTYGKSFMIAGHQMYRIGKNQYVKKANF